MSNLGSKLIRDLLHSRNADLLQAATLPLYGIGEPLVDNEIRAMLNSTEKIRRLSQAGASF